MMLWLRKICANRWFPVVPALLFAGLTYILMSGRQTISVEFHFANSVPESQFGSFYVFVPEYNLGASRGQCWPQGVYKVLCAKFNAERTIFSTRIPKKAQAVFFSANLPHSEQILREIHIGTKVLKETDLTFFNISAHFSKEIGGVKIISGKTIAQPGIQLKDTEKNAGFPFSTLVVSIIVGGITFAILFFFPIIKKRLLFFIPYRRFIVNSVLFIWGLNVVLLLIVMLTPETAVSIKMNQPGKYTASRSSQYYTIFKPIYSNLGRALFKQVSPTELTAKVLPITQTLQIHDVNWQNVDQLKIGSKVFSASACQSIISANSCNICVYHFDNELRSWRVRTVMIFLLGNLLSILGAVGIFFLMYGWLKKVPSEPYVNHTLGVVHHSPKTICHIFFSAIVIALFLFVFYRLNVLQIHQTMSAAIVGDELFYCAVAAEKQAGIPDSESVSPYTFLYVASPAIQIVQGYVNRFIGNNPEIYKIETWMYRNLQLIALIAFIFFFVRVSRTQKFFWATMILLLHHCMPVIAPYSNDSGLGIAIMYFTISAYVLFFRDDSKWLIFLAGIISGMAYLGRTSIIHFPLVMSVIYFYIKSNITRQYMMSFQKFILFLLGYLLIWGGTEIMEYFSFGALDYWYSFKIHGSDALLGAHGMAVGAWSCDWLWNNITNHFQDMIKWYGIFVYVYCALLVYSLLKCFTFEDKKITHYLPAVAILVGFAQVVIFFCVQRVTYYVTISYLFSLMGLSAVFLFPRNKNSAYPLTILFCCFLWATPNLTQLRSLEELKEPNQPLQLYTVNYALCSMRYPHLPLLLYKNPAYRYEYSQLRLSKPDLHIVKEAKDVIEFAQQQDVLLCLWKPRIPFLKTCTGIEFHQVEDFGNFVWFYATKDKFNQ